MPLGDIKLSSNFELSSQRPVDAKILVNDITERDAIPFVKRYPMMKVSVISELKTFVLKYALYDAGLNNNLNWAEDGAGVADHDLLTKLGWEESGHIGTPDTVPAFDSLGAAEELAKVDVLNVKSDWNAVTGYAEILNKPNLSQLHTQNTDYQILGPSSLVQSSVSAGNTNINYYNGIIKYINLSTPKALSKFRFWNTSPLLTGYVLEVLQGVVPGGLPSGNLGTTADYYITPPPANTLLKRVNISTIVQNGWAEFIVDLNLSVGDYSLVIYRPGQLGVSIGYYTSNEVEVISQYRAILISGLNTVQSSGAIGYLKFQADYGSSSVIANSNGVNIVGASVTINGNPISGSNTGDQDLSGLLKLNQATPQTVINGSPLFDIGIRYNHNNLSNPAYEQGLTFYDHSKNALSYYNDEPELTINLGQELIIPIVNNTAAIIPNGSLVYPTGVLGDRHTVALANAFEPEKCRLIAMTTHEIGIGETGYATRFGSVGGLNTGGQSGIVYLSPFLEGKWTTTRPTGGNFVITVGAIKKSDILDGSITIDPVITDLTVEMIDTNGFPESQRAKSELTYDNGTRTLTHTPITGHVSYYQAGKKYIMFAPETIVWDDIEGFHYIYYNLGVLNKIANPTPAQIRDLILNKCLVCTLYWDSTNKKVLVDLLDARHGISASPFSHFYSYLTGKAVYESGLKLGNFIANAAGDLDTHAQFSATDGRFFVQDLEIVNDPVAVGEDIEVIYNLGTYEARSSINPGFAVLNAPGGRLYYNFYDTGNWTLAEANDGYYVMYHIMAINGINTGFVSAMGNDQYATFEEAQAVAHKEMLEIIESISYTGFLPIGTIIFQTSNAYTNSVKARIVSVFPNENYVDWTLTSLADGIAPPSHTELQELYLADNNILFGHISYRDQNIFGVKTFNSFPITPSSAPTTNYQVANKKYVDDISFVRPSVDAAFNTVMSTSLNSTEEQRGFDSRFGTGIPVDEKKKFKVITSVSGGNMTVSIAFVGAYTSFLYYINNKRFVVTGANIAAYTQTVNAAIEAEYFFYINQSTTDADAPVMILSTVPWVISDPDVLLWNMYFNATSQAVERIGNEKHTYGRDLFTHPRNHAQGAVYSSGLLGTFYNGLSNTQLGSNTDNNFGRALVQISGGRFFDEDLLNSILHSDTAIPATWDNPETDWEKTVYQFLGFTALAAVGTNTTTIVFPTSRTLVTGQAVLAMAGNTTTARRTATIVAGGTGTTFTVTPAITGMTTGDAIVIPGRIPIYYISSIVGGKYIWRKLAATDFLGVVGGLAATSANIASGVFQYNNTAGGFANITANRYFPVYLMATNFINEPVIAILGQGQSTNSTLATALTEAPFQFGNLAGISGLEIQEQVPFYRLTFIYNTTGAFSNSRIRLSDATFINVRASTTSTVGGGGIPGISDHSLLTSLGWSVGGHTGTPSRLASFDESGLASFTDPSVYALWAGGTFTGVIKSTKKSTTPLDLTNSIYLSSDNTLGIRQYGSPTNSALYVDLLHPTDGDVNILRIDPSGISVRGSVWTTNGIGYSIDPKIATDLPSTYPQGTTMMLISNDGSWVKPYGLVHTYNSGTVYQTFQDSQSPYMSYTRVKTDGANTWQAWREVSNSLSISGTDTYIPKFTGTSSLGNSSLLDNGFSIVSSLGIQAPGLVLIRSGASIASIEIGNTDGTATTPFIDFHSGATAADYDARIIASGGTGVNGGGKLRIEGMLGIGVDPTNKLEVAGNISVFTTATNPASGATIKGLTFGYDNNSEQSWIQAARNSSGEIRQLQINPLGGNVGVGTAPSFPLHVSGDIAGTSSILLQRSSGSLYLDVMNFGDTLGGAVSDNLSIGNQGGSAILFHANGTEKMRLTAGGDLGIGKVPGTKLDVAGTIRTSGQVHINGAAPYIHNFISDVNHSLIGSDAGIYGTNPNNLGLYIYGDNSFEFSTNGVRRAWLNSIGLGIGVTPVAKLHVDAGTFAQSNYPTLIKNSNAAAFPHVGYDTFVIQQDDAVTFRLVEAGETLAYAVCIDGGYTTISSNVTMRYFVGGSYNSVAYTGFGLAGSQEPSLNMLTTGYSGRKNPRVASLSPGTFAPNINAYDVIEINSITSSFTVNAPTGTPVNKQTLMFDFAASGAGVSITWNAAYVNGGSALPTSLTNGKQTSVLVIYNSATATWKCRSVATDA